MGDCLIWCVLLKLDGILAEGNVVFFLKGFNDLVLYGLYESIILSENLDVFAKISGHFSVFTVGNGGYVYHHGFVRFDPIVSGNRIGVFRYSKYSHVASTWEVARHIFKVG